MGKSFACTLPAVVSSSEGNSLNSSHILWIWYCSMPSKRLSVWCFFFKKKKVLQWKTPEILQVNITRVLPGPSSRQDCTVMKGMKWKIAEDSMYEAKKLQCLLHIFSPQSIFFFPVSYKLTLNHIWLNRQTSSWCSWPLPVFLIPVDHFHQQVRFIRLNISETIYSPLPGEAFS